MIVDIVQHHRSALRVLLFTLSAACLSACGAKGPLYMPDAKVRASKPAAPVLPEPAADRPVPADAVQTPK